MNTDKKNIFSGQWTDWNGFKLFDLDVNGIPGKIVKPNRARPGKKWLWRVKFFNAFPSLDIAMLKKGFYLVYTEETPLFGAPAAMEKFDKFYDFVVNELGFCQKTVLEGYSRGGLTAYNWAVRNTEKVACIYADNPVCDFKSWPGGKGCGPGSPSDWQQCLKAYGFTEEQALAFKKNPLDNLAPLAAAGIPIIHVVGDADETVPVCENSDIVEKRYRKLGGVIEVIHKPEQKHHPHCLENPRPIVNFITQYYS